MYATPDQMTAQTRAGVENLFTLARSGFAAFETLAALNFNATKAAFKDGINHTRALLSARDVQEYVNLNTAAAQPSLDKFIAYSRSVYEITTKQQAEFTRLVEGQAGVLNKSFVGALDQFARNAPAGSDVAIAAMKRPWARRALRMTASPRSPSRQPISRRRTSLRRPQRG